MVSLKTSYLAKVLTEWGCILTVWWSFSGFLQCINVHKLHIDNVWRKFCDSILHVINYRGVRNTHRMRQRKSGNLKSFRVEKYHFPLITSKLLRTFGNLKIFMKSKILLEIWFPENIKLCIFMEILKSLGNLKISRKSQDFEIS